MRTENPPPKPTTAAPTSAATAATAAAPATNGVNQAIGLTMEKKVFFGRQDFQGFVVGGVEAGFDVTKKTASLLVKVGFGAKTWGEEFDILVLKPGFEYDMSEKLAKIGRAHV